MTDVAVEVNHVWKRFHRGELHDSLRDLVPALAKRLVGRARKRDELGEGDFWALRDIHFRVKRGEVLGIIGANGAGKSTLLKILARILRPNRGSIRVDGRLRALIEIAAGFHQDLTGGENIYLNGTILGMKRREIDAKFDEIVEFSGIGPFLDTPVKRYSSGMYARLGFAVAAHLEPEVLVVDEVLSVGDAEFQKRCLEKMESVAGEGRTVLFVSHNLTAVQSLRSRALVLDRGAICYDGPPEDAIGDYLSRHCTGDDSDADFSAARLPGYKPVIRTIQILDSRRQVTKTTRAGSEVTFRIVYESTEPLVDPVFGIRIDTMLGESLFVLQTRLQHGAVPTLPARGTAECRIRSLPLVPDVYSVSADCRAAGQRIDHVEHAMKLTVAEGDFFGTGRMPNRRQGSFLVPATWSFSGVDDP